jgi:hypothetical protein
MAVESPPRLPCSLHIPDCPHLHIDLAPPIHKKELDAKIVSGPSQDIEGTAQSRNRKCDFQKQLVFAGIPASDRGIDEQIFF